MSAAATMALKEHVLGIAKLLSAWVVGEHGDPPSTITGASEITWTESEST